MFAFLRRSMAARLLAVGMVALVTSGAQVSCNARTGTGEFESGDGPTFTTTLQLKDAAGAVRHRFEVGEPITLELTVRNRTSRPVELDFASGQQYEFYVFESGSTEIAWLFSSVAMFTQAQSRLVFAAGESKVFTVEWSPQAPPRRLEARGALLFDELRTNPQAPHELGSTLVAFTVD